MVQTSIKSLLKTKIKTRIWKGTLHPYKDVTEGSDRSIIEVCKSMHGRDAELETSIYCLFNFKDQRFSN